MKKDNNNRNTWTHGLAVLVTAVTVVIIAMAVNTLRNIRVFVSNYGLLMAVGLAGAILGWIVLTLLDRKREKENEEKEKVALTTAPPKEDVPQLHKSLDIRDYDVPGPGPYRPRRNDDEEGAG